MSADNHLVIREQKNPEHVSENIDPGSIWVIYEYTGDYPEYEDWDIGPHKVYSPAWVATLDAAVRWCNDYMSHNLVEYGYIVEYLDGTKSDDAKIKDIPRWAEEEELDPSVKDLWFNFILGSPTPPKMMFQSLETTVGEAKRLCSRTGKTVYVMHAHGAFVPPPNSQPVWRQIV